MVKLVELALPLAEQTRELIESVRVKS
jgi:hypothetical protein